MTPQEIKEKVDALYSKIEKAIAVGIFVLNPDIAEAYDEIEKLQNQCEHEFDNNGCCKYCYGSKEQFNDEVK